jgi:hypothetical protein
MLMVTPPSHEHVPASVSQDGTRKDHRLIVSIEMQRPRGYSHQKWKIVLVVELRFRLEFQARHGAICVVGER